LSWSSEGHDYKDQFKGCNKGGSRSAQTGAGKGKKPGAGKGLTTGAVRGTVGVQKQEQERAKQQEQ